MKRLDERGSCARIALGTVYRHKGFGQNAVATVSAVMPCRAACVLIAFSSSPVTSMFLAGSLFFSFQDTGIWGSVTNYNTVSLNCMQDLLNGVIKFQQEVYPEKKALFARLAGKQTPSALFITCADSRVVPDLLTQCEPGDLFICRNAGNIVPTYGGSAMGGVSATIEYAVVALKIEHIVVLGHSDCGAMKGILHPDQVKHMPAVAAWLNHGDIARLMVEENYPDLDEEGKLRAIIEENVIAQVEHLRTHPSVATRLARNKISIHGWIYNIENGTLWAFDANEGCFVPLDGRTSPSAVRRVRRKMDADGSIAGGL